MVLCQEKVQIESTTIRAYIMNLYEERNFNYVRGKTTQTVVRLYARTQIATC